MFKKFTAALLLTAFTQVYAVTPVQQSMVIADELNRTFDELNYQLNVEWNQKDPAFINKALDDFSEQIASLQKQGLSSKELVQYTLDKIKDKQTRDEINQIAKVIDENQMSPEEARAFTLSKMNSTYSHGTSWSGSRIGGHVAFVIGVIILIIYCSQKQTTEKPCPPDQKDGRDGQHDGGHEGGHDGGHQGNPCDWSPGTMSFDSYGTVC